MDKGEPAESSSSQNVNLSIRSIKKRGTGKETVTVTLSDGSSFFIPLPLPGHWFEGICLNEGELEKLRLDDAYVRGREWAAGRLALREDSSGRLLQKLRGKGWEDEAGRRILRDMEKLGFLDDARFSRLWLRERLQSHPEGKSALLAGLLKRGVPASIARRAIEDNVCEEDIALALESCLARLKRSGDDGDDHQEKMIQKLRRRGFSWKDIQNQL